MNFTINKSNEKRQGANYLDLVSTRIFFSLQLLILVAVLLLMAPCRQAATAAPSVAAVVHTTGPIVIDGNDGDWSSIAAAQSIRGSLDTVATFKLAYDSTAFYALVHVKDSSPLANSSTIYQELLKGGDAIGLCFGPATPGGPNQRIILAHTKGGDRIVVMRPTWPGKPHPYTYYTSAGGTVLMDDVHRIDTQGARVAFKIVQGGYIAEVKIPFSILGYHPVAGLRFPFDAQVIFSDPAGTTNVATAWWHSSGAGPDCTTDLATEARLYPDLWGYAQLFAKDPGPAPEQIVSTHVNSAFVPHGVPITFTVPHDCKVSVIILNSKGWVVRELLRAENMVAGKQTIWWDGRDRWGAIDPPGHYTYRIAFFNGIKATFAASAGNSGIPPYRTADGLGSIGGMHGGPCVVCADFTGVYMGNMGEEGQPAIRKMDTTTLKSLWFHSAGTFGGAEAIASDGVEVCLIYGSNNVSYFARLDPQTGANLPIGKNNAPITLGGVQPAGMAIMDGKAYYSVPAANEIQSIDLATGSPGEPISIQIPMGICSTLNRLYVCSMNSVVEINPVDGKTSTLITGLDSPAGIVVDKEGHIFVSETGKSQQIKRFGADGHLEITFGDAGGRHYPENPYDPMAFQNITGLAMGPEGNLWAVEHLVEAPRRYIELTTDGKWVRDIYGPARCGTTVGFDEDDPTSIYYQAPYNPIFTNATVDYAAYALSPDPFKGFHINSLWMMTQNGIDSTATPDLMAGKDGPADASYSRVLVFTGPANHRYFWATSGSRAGIWIWRNNRWMPAATVGSPNPKDPYQYWSDKNGDGLVEPDEGSTEVPPTSSWSWIGRDLTLYGLDGSLSPAAIDARGVPTYVGGKYTPYLNQNEPPLSSYFDDPAYYPASCPGSTRGTAYFSENNGPHQNHDFWDRCSENRIIKVKGGKVVWMVGHHDGRLRHDGDSMVLFGISGEVDGVVIASDVAGQFIAYTSDGIPLGWVLTGPDGRTPQVGPNAIYVENAAPGEFIKDPNTGRRLLITHTSEDVRVLNITGVFGNDITRVNGTLTLTSSVPRPSIGQPGVTMLPYSTWANSMYEQWRSTNVDGYDYEWPSDAAALGIRKAGALTADIRLRRDAGRLCIYADVLDPNAFGASTLGQSSVFGAGAGIEIDLGPAANATRTTAGPGDARIFLTAIQKSRDDLTGIALACKSASKPIGPSQELSPMNTAGEYLDHGTIGPTDLSHGLTPIPGAQICVRKRFDGQGYVIEAELPIAAFPELAKIQPVSFYHGSHKSDSGERRTEERSDLVLPLRINAAVWLSSVSGKATRIPWKEDGFSGNDPKVMDPARWGVATNPPSVMVVAGADSAARERLHYEDTQTSVFSWGRQPNVFVSSCLLGGRWALTPSGSAFVTTAPREGFSIVCPPAGGPPPFTDRIAGIDMTAVGIPYAGAYAERATATAPIQATVQYSFGPGQSGKLHVLWGSYTDNSASGASLTVADNGDETFDARKYPDLSFDGPYNGPFYVRESVFTVSGTGTLTVSVSSHHGSYAYLEAVWIEPIDITTFRTGVPVSLGAYAGAGSAAIRSVDFLIDGNRVGSTSKAPFNFKWIPGKPGFYNLTAKVVDDLGVSAVSDSLDIKVTGK